MRIYVMQRKESPWGDYGDILVHGMTRHLPRHHSLLQLVRSGPYLPAITLPGIHDLVIAAPVRDHIRGLGLEFRSVLKTHIVRLEWQTWDLQSEEPQEYPDSGEPEDYLIERDHDEQLASQMPELWEVVPAVNPDIQVGGEFNVRAYNGEPYVCADEFGGYAFVSHEFKAALELLHPEWVEFQPHNDKG